LLGGGCGGVWGVFGKKKKSLTLIKQQDESPPTAIRGVGAGSERTDSFLYEGKGTNIPLYVKKTAVRRTKKKAEDERSPPPKKEIRSGRSLARQQSLEEKEFSVGRRDVEGQFKQTFRSFSPKEERENHANPSATVTLGPVGERRGGKKGATPEIGTEQKHDHRGEKRGSNWPRRSSGLGKEGRPGT